ncbi:hypothetical protein SUGI_0724880 [Cryptomeria japonica]|uniref:cytochrome P450 720B2 n=1 Tax=Cryptomeria japonica TaxID=3369 RepID=UPI0024148EFE|nr:cytochrome P450 720B2 [Cryptomeria japonica]GLJ36135.1 hypothetical protein SUGI_0724880 [Cryptomeria japonica]
MELGLMVLASAFTLALAALTWWAIGRNGNGNYKDYNLPLPRGATGWPLIGETITFLRAINNPHNPRKLVDHHERKYGPVFRSNLFGSSKTVVTVDPEFSKYVLQNEGRLFHTKYPLSMRTIIGKFSILAVRGELQRKLHGTVNKFLSVEMLSSESIGYIQNIFDLGMLKWEGHNRELHLQEEIHKVVLNLMAKKLLDLNPENDMKEIDKLRALDDLAGAIVTIPINIPGSPFSKGIKARKTLHKKINECIKERKEHPEVVRSDLLTHLLKEAAFPEEVIAELILSLFFASYETSSKALTFAIKFLTDSPRALKEMRAEHDALVHLRGNGKLTWDDYASMNFTHCVIKETLRLGNVAPAVFRETAQDIKTKDFVIPKGWAVLVLLNSTHLDEKNYPEALTFNPWRWQHEPPLELSKDPWFLCFGGGARFCPGYQFAKLEMALFLHCFITKFRWEAVEEDHLHYFPYTYMVKGLPLRLSPLQ